MKKKTDVSDSHLFRCFLTLVGGFNMIYFPLDSPNVFGMVDYLILSRVQTTNH